MTQTRPALPGTDGTPLIAPPLAPALPAIDAEAAGLPELPADHPPWQRDAVSISARARAVVATLAPAVVRVLTYWDHRVREVAFGARTLALDPAGGYRLR